MKDDRILTVLNDIDDDMLLDAQPGKRRTVTRVWRVLAPLAACLVLILGIGLYTGEDSAGVSILINGDPMQAAALAIPVEKETDRNYQSGKTKAAAIRFDFAAEGEIAAAVSGGILRVAGNTPDAQKQAGKESLAVTWHVSSQEMPAVMTVLTGNQTVQLRVSYDPQEDSWIITKENIK